jgi:hypothetical protein
MRQLIFALTMAIATSAFAQTNTLETATKSPTTFDPITAYATREMEGWHVLVNQKLLAETNLCERVLKILGAQLYQITRVVPSAPLAKLRLIPIWVELDDPLFPGACYHESRDWLAAHGVNPAKTGAVELANATHFTTWTIEQPCMILHELSHGYHHQFLGDDFAGIRKCYEHAKAAGIYDSVLRANGHHERHYAMNSEKEYFAEMTEAFFGTNDFYPFVRAELKEHDPQIFALLCEVWDVKP